MGARVAQLGSAIQRLPWWLVVVLGVSSIIAAVLSAVVGGAPATVAFIVLLAVTALAASLAAEAPDRTVLVGAVLAAFLLRALIATMLEGYLQGTAPGSVFTPDEALYISVARSLAEHWRDPDVAFDATEPHLPTVHVQLMALIFWAIGPNVLVVKLVNSALGTIAPLFLYRAMRAVGLPGARLATIVAILFPSLLFWSTLVLKDAYVEFGLLVSVWCTSQFVRTRHYRWVIATTIPLIALDTVRRYSYFGMALALLTVPIAFPNWRERLKAGAAVVVTVAIMFAVFDPLSDAGPNPLYLPILSRGAGAEGARSAFVEPLPVIRGDAGDRFIVAVSGRTAPPGQTPQVVVVAYGTEVVVDGSSPQGTGPYVTVRAGDTIVIAGSPGASPPPAVPGRTPEIVVLHPGAKNLVGPAVVLDPDATSITGSLTTNIRNLPNGMLHVAFAPFPWTARSLLEFAAVPEMLLWYLLVPLSVVGGISLIRRRDFGFIHGAAFLGGMFVALSLVASNTGTLIRSRAMIIPFVIAFAAVGAAPLIRERLPKGVRWIGD